MKRLIKMLIWNSGTRRFLQDDAGRIRQRIPARHEQAGTKIIEVVVPYSGFEAVHHTKSEISEINRVVFSALLANSRMWALSPWSSGNGTVVITRRKRRSGDQLLSETGKCSSAARFCD